MSDFFQVILAIAIGWGFWWLHKRERVQRETKKAEAIRRAQEKVLSELREDAHRTFSVVAAHPSLQEYVRIAAGTLGKNVLSQHPVQKPPSVDLPRGEYAKKLILIAGQRFGVALPRIAVRFSQLEGKHAGMVRQRGGTWYVDLAHEYADDDLALAAIIAHEMAHVVLLNARVFLQSEQRNEELTDATAVLAGFGPLLLDAYWREEVEVTEQQVNARVHRLGYLPPAGVLYLTAIQLEIAGLPAPLLRQKVAGWLASELSSVEQLWSAWRALNSTAESYPCFACGIRMRLPAVAGAVRLTCPCCGLRQVV
jgi:hypothetical protein